MTCERIEELLPLYVEGDISGDDRRLLEAHLEGCAACRESLAASRSIEAALVSRRELLPDASRTAAAVIERLRPHRSERPYYRPYYGWIGARALAFVLLVVAAAALYIFRGAVADFVDFMEREGGPAAEAYSRGVGEWTRWVVHATGGDDFTLLLVLLGTTALMLAAGGWMVLRLVRT